MITKDRDMTNMHVAQEPRDRQLTAKYPSRRRGSLVFSLIRANGP
eukprot:SAG11_NODE_36686_length_260_cov_0.956522_1_plen_44_part_10